MIGKHLFDPKTFGVSLTRFFGVSQIRDQQPRLGLLAIPNRHQIDSMRRFPIHGDFDRPPETRPAAAGQVSRAVPISQVLDAGSGLDPQHEIQSQFLLDPSRQVDRMKLPVGNDGRARAFRQTFFEPGEQLLLKFQIRIAFVRDSHPTQGQRPITISHRDVQEVDRVVDHRPIHQRVNPAAPATMEAFENLPGDRLERVERNQFLALDQPLESLNPRLDLNRLVRHSPTGFRQRNAPAVGDSDHQQRQIFQMRLMKARDKAFHAQAKLVSYFPQIHLLLLVVYSQQLQEILMYLLLAFKKRPPVKSKLITRRNLLAGLAGGLLSHPLSSRVTIGPLKSQNILDPSELAKFRERLKGRLILPSDRDY